MRCRFFPRLGEEDGGTMSASFQEKSTWIKLAAMVACMGLYFVIAVQMLTNGVRDFGAFGLIFMQMTVLMVVVLAAGHGVVAALGRQEAPDERDRLISCKANHRSSWVLAVGVCCGLAGLALSVDAVWVAHGLLLSLVLAEVLHDILRLVSFRRGV